ncbi:hypothetical protein ACFLWN_03640 [Chloroflexota bacterium]
MSKTRRLFLIVLAITLILTVVLIALETYFVAVSLIIGGVLFGHREIWSLVTRKKLPPVDERVQENINKAVRNGFIFFVAACAFLMLPFSTVIVRQPEVVPMLGGLLVSGGTVYLLSYLFYERVGPNLSERELWLLRIFFLISGISIATFVIGVVVHNFLSALIQAEEPVFFIVAVFVSPAALLVGIIGSLFLYFRGLCRRTVNE